MVFHGPRLARLMDGTVAPLHRRLDAESEHDLTLRMHFPARWDPYFGDTMSRAEVYRYGT